jgi:hypothetical protein
MGSVVSGWFAMKRGVTSHPLFKGRPDRLAVWVWLMDNAAWKDTTQDVNGHTVKVPRGSVCVAERRMCDEIGVGRQVLRTFLTRLEADTMITRKVTHGRSLITLCNWDKYQTAKVGPNPTENPKPTQDQPTKETREQDTLEANASNDAGASLPIEVSVTSSAVWNAGKPFLASRGVTNAGAMIGRWLKDHPPLALLAAIEAAQKSGTHDPIPYINEALKGGRNHVQRTAKSTDMLRAFIGGAD